MVRAIQGLWLSCPGAVRRYIWTLMGSRMYDVLLACSSKLSMNVQVSNFSEGLKDRLGGQFFTSHVCALCWLNDLMHYI